MATIAEFDKEAADNISAINSRYELILKYLANAESGKIHFNPSETDITSPRGIYRAVNKGRIWDYVDALAASVGITKPSNKWTKAELDKVNAIVNQTTMKYFEYLFYKNYYGRIAIDRFPDSIVLTAASIFANTEKGAVLSIQYAADTMYKLNPDYLGLPKTDISAINGGFGEKTIKAIDAVAKAPAVVQDLFDSLMCMYALVNHVNIVANNPDKYFKFLNGWKNRDADMLLAEKNLN